ncbi:MAG TPA: hypothetical protein VLT37_08535 [Acidocella sp.]|nr:hypothetical protein [Acidocella sp.]
MSLPCTRKAGAALGARAALAALALASPARAIAGNADSPASGAVIRFCVDEANPLSTTDRAVAQAVAARSGLRAEFVKLNTGDDGVDGDGDDAKIDLGEVFAKMAEQCDLIMGVPVEPNGAGVPHGMQATRPYERTGFVMATTGAPVRNFDAMAATTDVGVDFLTVPNSYFDTRTAHAEHVYYTNDDLLAALLKGEVGAAMVWQPWLVWEEAAHPHNLRTGVMNMPDAAWNVVALYTPRAAAQAQAFNQGLERLEQAGQLKALVAPYQAAGE